MKKIMFNDAYGLTQATIEGWKTNTRRAEFNEAEQELLTEADEVYIDGNDVVAVFDTGGNVRLGTRYKVGEVVAIAQNYGIICAFEGVDHDDLTDKVGPVNTGWRNKMFVKAELMPHQIRITGIKCERLQDISDEDCFKEGIFVNDYIGNSQMCHHYGFDGFLNGDEGWFARGWYNTPRDAFSALIDKVSGRGAWARNPWVVAYEYKLVK